jgi:hypothetical protein
MSKGILVLRDRVGRGCYYAGRPRRGYQHEVVRFLDALVAAGSRFSIDEMEEMDEFVEAT